MKNSLDEKKKQMSLENLFKINEFGIRNKNYLLKENTHKTLEVFHIFSKGVCLETIFKNLDLHSMGENEFLNGNSRC